MIILHLSGGLGNQMFQYAFGRATAKKLGAELKLELTDPTLIIHNGFELERVFNIQASGATEADIQAVLGMYRYRLIRKAFKVSGVSKIFKSPTIEEPHFHYSPEMLAIPDRSYINGYWQSEKYFLEIESEIRSDFNFKLPMSRQNADLAEIISQTNSVSLHVRRNDFAKNSKINSTHGLCSLKYYQAAIRYIAGRVERPSFFVFSDDATWVKSNLKIDFPCEFVEHNQGSESYNDMRLMSLCQHHIIANSSFSWWGAWLNPDPNKLVVAPQAWFANLHIDTRDLIPADWMRVSN
jgi:hypothetical protein